MGRTTVRGRRFRTLIALSAAVILGTASLTAANPQKYAKLKKRDRCTVCGHDEELLRAQGQDHGPFTFGRSDTEAIAKEMTWHPTVLETTHFRIVGDFPKWKIPEGERKRYRAELTALKEKFPAVNAKTAVLDRWYRIHLLADKLEQVYSEVQDLFGTSESAWLDPERNRMRGVGPFLGEQDKYEVMVFEQRSPYREYMTNTWGLAYVKPQRYNNVDRDMLWFGLNLEEEDIHSDRYLQNVILHGVAHNLLDGYEHYSYELPVWITEGFAHWIERENDPRYATFCTIEGSFEVGRSVRRWAPEVRKLIQKGKAATFASLLRRASFAELSFDDHLVIWSKIDFLIRSDRGAFGNFITDLKTRRDPRTHLPDGSHMDDVQRESMRKRYGWTMARAEQAWKDWVMATYPVK